jgi:hypothetical protein
MVSFIQAVLCTLCTKTVLEARSSETVLRVRTNSEEGSNSVSVYKSINQSINLLVPWYGEID